ncbi:hypothetical protein [Niallia sp. RD1]|uniref:hypothetical protein n=1 Tax=Niallia sp. RD1 TaxID=2962858 RepID=UPI0020C1ADAC|nr:hypothetical protein [Niallia sp. RD1]UTI41141.1 hypothetical protein NKG37_20105 [Niallia sp. RD1]
MEKNRFSKPVAFNNTVEKDILILNHIRTKKNFSGYVKQLILSDIENNPTNTPLTNKPLSASERLQQLKKRPN